MEATLELIAENGFHGTPMSQIAKKANISVGVIYHYFTNKNDLINELYINIQTKLSKTIYANYPLRSSMKENFIAGCKNVFDYFIEHPKELLFLEQYKNSPLITAENREQALRLFESHNSFFKIAIEQNIVKEMPVELLTALVSGSLNSLIKLYLANIIKIEEKEILVALGAIWDMFKK